jgi:hypothetical protein
MGILLGNWDEHDQALNIQLPNGQQYHVNGTQILSGGHKVFGVVTVEKEIHVLTGPKSNTQPNRRVKYSDSGVYKGSSSI